MTDQDLKQLKDLFRGELFQFHTVLKKEINQALKPIKVSLANHTKKINMIWDQVAKLTVEMAEVREVQRFHTQILKQHTTILDEHTLILKNHSAILNEHTYTLKSHTTVLDKLDTKVGHNNINVKRLDNRLEVIEDKVGIVPSSKMVIIR
jgi:hypothetical protein